MKLFTDFKSPRGGGDCLRAASSQVHGCAAMQVPRGVVLHAPIPGPQLFGSGPVHPQLHLHAAELVKACHQELAQHSTDRNFRSIGAA
eukprot:CAMPEP_0204519482 /NCGR_PEP_ID=MMETSP0661-20131031/4758_1 /ASSEMBLY_ACC=CAM_ASM_000606 /TAXON_ID=109239 /ORGANISM="Alexandrium margalefi, Strain AMGDE01CS-322" /LENGTH=87 /DNA_ID=CAMNT_0051524987 /DNA_START=25 /DNA_END=285 /DNA_ORIENTATION=-